MKNYLTLVLALSVVSAPAFASRARLESLGEGKNGSYYIDDARNIFIDPAQIVHYKKKLWLETGTEPQGSATTGNGATAAPDLSVTGNRVQGGFSNTFGDFTYGVYMNQTSERTLQTVNTANTFVLGGVLAAGGTVAAGSNFFIAPDSTIEAFFAGEGAVNWGISAFYAGNENKTANVDKTASQVGVRLGADVNNLKAFVTVALASKANVNNGAANTNELKGKVGVDGAVTYSMNEMTGFAKVTIVGTDLNTPTTTELRTQQYGLGAGWKHEMTKSTNMFARTEFDWVKTGSEQVADGVYKGYNLPVVVGAESQALSWLAIRGSIQESIIGQLYNGSTRNSLGGTTTVSLGAGLTFGDVQIDGLVATTATPNNPANTSVVGNVPGFGTAPQSGGGLGLGDNMLTRVAVTYNF